MSISDQITSIRKSIDAALKRSAFGHRDVTVMGASKDQSLNKIREASELGIVDMGENYAQEVMTKAPMSMSFNIRWHFIGKLQSNKIKHILPYISSIDSVDSVELAKKISRVREQLSLNKPRIPIMIQVNVGNERQKSGLPPQIVEDLFSEFLAEEGVEVVGLMCIPPAHKEAEKSRPYFKLMKELFDRLAEVHPRKENFRYLSMGMSNDYEVAIEEGANVVRLGTCLFGPRPQKQNG